MMEMAPEAGAAGMGRTCARELARVSINQYFFLSFTIFITRQTFLRK